MDSNRLFFLGIYKISLSEEFKYFCYTISFSVPSLQKNTYMSKELLSWLLWGRRWICPSPHIRNCIIPYLRNLAFFSSFASAWLFELPCVLFVWCKRFFFYYTSPHLCHSLVFPALLPYPSRAEYRFTPSQLFPCPSESSEELWLCVRFRQPRRGGALYIFYSIH